MPDLPEPPDRTGLYWPETAEDNGTPLADAIAFTIPDRFTTNGDTP